MILEIELIKAYYTWANFLSEMLLLIFPFSLMILEIVNNVIQCDMQSELLIKAYWSSDNVHGRFQKRQEPVTREGDKQVGLGG